MRSRQPLDHSLSASRRKGHRAYQQGKAAYCNPFTGHEAAAWRQGWQEARTGKTADKPILAWDLNGHRKCVACGQRWAQHRGCLCRRCWREAQAGQAEPLPQVGGARAAQEAEGVDELATD